MKAIVFKDVQHISIENKINPFIKKRNEVLVKVYASGICGTDLGIYYGHFLAKKETILGHEAAGVVVEVGEGVCTLKSGDRVVINPTFYCGQCSFCFDGTINHCLNKLGNEIGVDKHGTHSEYIVIEERFLHKIPDDMPFERAILVEPLACVLNNLYASGLSFNDNVLIFGAGPIGSLWSIAACQITNQVTIADKDSFRLNLIKNHIENYINLKNAKNFEERCHILLREFKFKKPSLIIDTTGTLLEESLELIENNGRIVLMGFNKDHQATLKPLTITTKGIKIIGAGDYSFHIPEAIHLAQKLCPEFLVTHQLSLDNYEEAFTSLLGHRATQDQSSRAMKVMFKIAV